MVDGPEDVFEKTDSSHLRVDSSIIGEADDHHAPEFLHTSEYTSEAQRV